MSQYRLAAAVGLTGGAGVLAGLAAADGRLEPATLVTAASGVGVIYVACAVAALAVTVTDQRTLAVPTAVALVAGVVADVAQRLLAPGPGLADLVSGGTVPGLGAPVGYDGGALAFGSLAITLALTFPLGLSWRGRHRWPLAGLVVAAGLPLAGLVATGLVRPDATTAGAVLTGLTAGGIVLVAALPLFSLGKSLRKEGWSGVATTPAFLAAVLGCGLQVLGVAVVVALAPSAVLSLGALPALLVALGPILLLAGHGFAAASRQRRSPSARSG